MISKDEIIKEKASKAVLWINRLATTRVKQGTGQLGDRSNGYCCLGYGCKILGIYFDSHDPDSRGFMEQVGMMSLGGNFDNPMVELDENNNDATSLIDLNDDHGFSFRRISTVIKKKVDEIFEQDVALEIYKILKNKRV
tara:strand:- start:60 stop:476 length:417 start_codon:yes stop_codon:yes gene_type:complete